MKKILASPLLLILPAALAAQEASTGASPVTGADTAQWYMQPWAWIAGGVVLIMLFIGLFRRRK